MQVHAVKMTRLSALCAFVLLRSHAFNLASAASAAASARKRINAFTGAAAGVDPLAFASPMPARRYGVAQSSSQKLSHRSGQVPRARSAWGRIQSQHQHQLQLHLHHNRPSIRVVSIQRSHRCHRLWGSSSDSNEEDGIRFASVPGDSPLMAIAADRSRRSSSADDARPENDMPYFIRPAMIQDMGPASRILADGFFKAQNNFLVYQWERLETYLSLDSAFPKPNALHAMFVACESQGSAVIGIVELDARVTKNGRGQNGPYMCNLAVDEKYKRQGVATALVDVAEEQVTAWTREADIMNSLRLQVRRSNVAAIAMYERLGYQSYIQEKNEKGEMILSMRRNLTKAS